MHDAKQQRHRLTKAEENYANIRLAQQKALLLVCVRSLLVVHCNGKIYSVAHVFPSHEATLSINAKDERFIFQ